jgi:NAD(P)-dependent dehydrogenase (short-subunit alcohol dehydrogenase family)
VSEAPNRKALVTGGASGLGFEIARRLASDGARVAVLDVDPDRTRQAVGRIDGDCLAVPADVRSRAEVLAAVRQAAETFSGLDTLVVAAGIIHVNALAAATEDEWDQTIDVNLKGPFLCSQAAAPALVASGRGRIVMISSDAGRRGEALLQAYTASKFGMIGLAQSLAAELAPNVTVNCVCPVGVPSTGMGRQMLSWKVRHTGRAPADVLARTARQIPMGRNATAADIANAVLFLVSDAAGFITGVALDVDGGASLDTVPGT